MKNIITIIVLLIGYATYAQCNTQINVRPDGNKIEYFNPVPVIKLSNYEVGTAIYKNTTTNTYNVGIAVLLKKSPQNDIEGSLIIRTTSPKGLSLPLLYSNVTEFNGNTVVMAIYKLDSSSLYELKSNPIKNIFFNMAGQSYGATISQNKDVYTKQISCLW